MIIAVMVKRKPLSKRRRTGRRGTPETTADGVWIYGVHAARAALSNPLRRCRRLLATAQTVESVAGGGIEPEILTGAEIAALLPAGAVHQGVAVEAAALPAVAIEEVRERLADLASACLIVLDQATDPRNVGAVLRSAAAFGAAAVVVQDRHAPEATAVLAKAASGALETVPLVAVTNVARTLALLKEAGFWCVGLDGNAERTLAATELAGRVVLVLGAEGGGLRRLTRQTCDHLARIPMGQAMDSLNLSNAAAVALYERARQLEGDA